MPRVPDDTPQFSMNVPGVNAPQTREFGKIGEATEQLGATVQNAGINLWEAVAKAQSSDAAANAYTKDKLDGAAKINDLKLMSPDGYIHDDPADPQSAISKNDDGSPRTIADEYHTWADERYKQSQSSMPSTLAVQMYRNRALPSFSDQTALLQNDANLMKTANFDQNMSVRVKQRGDSLADYHDIDNFYTFYNDTAYEGQQQVGVMHNQTDNDKKTAQFGQKLSRDYMKGVYTDLLEQARTNTDPAQINTSIDKALAEVRGQDNRSQARSEFGQPTLSNLMDPIQKAIEEDKLERLRQPMAQQSWENFKAVFANTNEALKMGQSSDATFQAVSQQILKYGLSDPSKAAESADMYGKLIGSQELGRLNDPAVQILPKAQRDAYYFQAEARAKQGAQAASQSLGLKGPFADDLGSIASAAIESQRQEQQNKIDGAQKEDLAAFAQTPVNAFDGRSRLHTGAKMDILDYENLPSLSQGSAPHDYANWSHEYNAYSKSAWSDHPSNYRAPITKEQSETIADQLNNPSKLTNELAGSGAVALTKFWGKDFDQNVQQMIKDKNLGAQYRILGLHAFDNDTDSMTKVMASLRGGAATQKMWDDTVKSPNITEPDLDAQIQKATATYNTAIAQKGELDVDAKETAIAVNKSVKTLAQNYQISHPGMGSSEAAQKAFSDLIGNYYTPSRMNSGWNSSDVVKNAITSVPRFVPMSTGSYDSYGEPGGIKDTIINNNIERVLKPENFGLLNAITPLKSNGQSSTFAANFPQLVQDTGAKQYTVNQGQPGFNIQYQDGNTRRYLMTQNKRGGVEKVFIPYEKVNQPVKPDASADPFFRTLMDSRANNVLDRKPNSIAEETYSSEEDSEGIPEVDKSANTGNSPTKINEMSSKLVLPGTAKEQDNKSGTTKNIQAQTKLDRNGRIQSVNFTHD